MTGQVPPPRYSWLSSDRAVPRLLARPIRTFLDTEAAGGLVLLAAAVAALLWANLAGDSYESFWTTEVELSIGSFDFTYDLRHVVNDGLMTLFFFVVGLEIKRELVVGELNERKKAMLPAVAALGGMVVPALLYALFNMGTKGSSGWGIPMATDIAFAVGVLALLSHRIPAGLKVFLLSLAIVDDIGAIAVIAIFYSSGFHLGSLLAAVGSLALVVFLRRANVYWVPAYVVLGTVVWAATLGSGIHATIAGVALGLLTPARPADPGGFPDVRRAAETLPAEPDAESLRALSLQGKEVVSVAERLGHLLHPWSSFAIIPIFALANAGVRLTGSSIAEATTSRVAVGVVVGLVVGKIVGISFASWLAVRTGIGRLPEGVTFRHVLGAAAVAGIGFTVSLFIASLAFTDVRLVTDAKLGILLGSVVAGLLGAAFLVRDPGPRTKEK